MRTLDTWEDYSGSTGKSSTRWNYDGYRGWLKSKDYPDAGTGLLPGTEGTTGPVYDYTKAGRLKTRTTLEGITTTYKYDIAGESYGTQAGDLQQILYSDPNTDGLTYAYDSIGRVDGVTQGTKTTALVYNFINQLLSESFSGGPLAGYSVEHGYNTDLKRTSMQIKQSGVLRHNSQYHYTTPDGRLSKVQSDTKNATYGYISQSGLVGTITFDTVATTTQQYDKLNRQTYAGTVSSGVTLSRTYEYNTLNQRTLNTDNDGAYWDYDYDDLGQLESGKRYWSDLQPVAGQHFTYSYDDIGNRQITHRGGDNAGANLRSSIYINNHLNQSESRTVPAVADVVGTASSSATVTVNGQEAERHGTYFHAEAELAPRITRKITAVSDVDGVVSGGYLYTPTSPEGFYYDDDGNLTDDGRWTYEWDAENRLVRMTKLFPSMDPLTPKIEFEYDYQGRRIAKKIYDDVNGSTPDETIGFIYDGWTLVATTDGGTNLDLAYVYGSDLSGAVNGASGIGGLLMVQDKATGDTWYVANNGKGDVIGLINATTGNFDAQYEYGPFGESIRVEGSEIAHRNHVRFSSKWRDKESGLAYYGFRYYNPDTGRWLNRDPISERGGLNLYGFVYNDPQGYIDTLGDYPSGYGFSWYRDEYGNIQPVKFGGDHAERLQEFVVEITVCCEGGIAGSGLGEWGMTALLTPLYMAEDFCTSRINVFKVGQSFEEKGIVAGLPEELDRIVTALEHVPGGMALKPIKEKLKDGCQAVCQRFIKRVKGKKGTNDSSKDLPGLDTTGKVHGDLPHPKELSEFEPDDLRVLRDELRRSVQERIRKNSELGRKGNHGLRQAQEQDLIHSIDKFLEGLKQ